VATAACLAGTVILPPTVILPATAVREWLAVPGVVELYSPITLLQATPAEATVVPTEGTVVKPVIEVRILNPR